MSSDILFPVWASCHAASTNTHFLSPQDPLPVHLLSTCDLSITESETEDVLFERDRS